MIEGAIREEHIGLDCTVSLEKVEGGSRERIEARDVEIDVLEVEATGVGPEGGNGIPKKSGTRGGLP